MDSLVSGYPIGDIGQPLLALVYYWEASLTSVKLIQGFKNWRFKYGANVQMHVIKFFIR